jgi:hypothetical protein
VFTARELRNRVYKTEVDFAVSVLVRKRSNLLDQLLKRGTCFRTAFVWHIDVILAGPTGYATEIE